MNCYSRPRSAAILVLTSSFLLLACEEPEDFELEGQSTGPMEPVEIDDPDLADAEPLVEFPETDPQASTFDPELTASIAPQ